jgi:transposase
MLPGGGKLGRHQSFLIRRVDEKPDITMPELAAELETAHGTKANPDSLSRFLCKAGFTYRKNGGWHRNKSGGAADDRLRSEAGGNA